MGVIQKLKIQDIWEGKENRNFVGGNTVMSSISHFHLFLHLKKRLASQKFREDEEVKNEVTTRLRVQAAEFCDIVIQKLIPRLKECLGKGGEYVEK
jgi:hypothetical protein